MTVQASDPSVGPVLVVDDDVHIRDILQTVLRSEGYAVEMCGDADEAARRISLSPRPSLVLLDLALPGMSGWELLDRLQRSRRRPAVPVVIVTATAAEASDELMRRGASAVLEKPIGLAELLSAVRVVLALD